MSDLPGGIVTFLLTDIEQSALLWQEESRAMAQAVAQHDQLAAEIIRDSRGILVKSRGEGDSLFAVFARATDAVSAACRLQRAFLASEWETETDLRVRIALHTGEADLREGDYYGNAVNRCARLRSVGHGGQILLSQTTYELVCDDLTADLSTRYLGQHRLKDLQRREHVYQLCHTELPAEFPALRSLDALPNNLPLQLTSFVGREKELARARELLSSTRLLTLTGMGGSGKTRLALQVAADALDEYPDGVWLVELDAITQSDPALIYRAIAAALDVREAPGQTLLATVSDFLRSRTLLLVMDNCEHLIEACAKVVQTLLRTCSGLRILATSRETLNVAGETAWQIPALSLPPQHDAPNPEELTPYEAVKLFVERAQSDNPNFTLTKENASAVVLICRGLDGMPLALELAAARVRVLTVQDIAARLDDRFLLLRGGSRSDPLRHRSLSGLIEWSYDLMTELERALLRRLSVFKGGWDLEAAVAVCKEEGRRMQEEPAPASSAVLRPPPSALNIPPSSLILPPAEVFDLLVRLVEISMVVVEEQQGTMRYRLLETVRCFGQQKLEEVGETETIRDRHLAYFLQMAEESEQKLTGPEQSAWLNRMERDHDNLRAALAWAVSPDLRLQVAGALCRFWVMRGYYTEGRSLLEGALSRGDAASPALRAKALNGLGVLAYRQNENAIARDYLKMSLDIRQQIGDERGVSEVLNHLGIVHRYIGEYEIARSYCVHSLELRRKQHDQWGTAAALNTLGMILLAQGDLQQARESYRECLSMYQELGDRAITATLSCNLADIEYIQENYTQARQLYEEGLQRFREIGDKGFIAITLGNLGETLRKLDDRDTAYRHLFESVRLFSELNNQGGLTYPLDSLARIAQVRQNLMCAVKLFSKAANLRESLKMSLPPPDQVLLEQDIENTRRLMSAASFEQAWKHGEEMALTELLSECEELTPLSAYSPS